jgi:hypothetical protein
MVRLIFKNTYLISACQGKGLRCRIKFQFLKSFQTFMLHTTKKYFTCVETSVFHKIKPYKGLMLKYELEQKYKENFNNAIYKNGRL